MNNGGSGTHHNNNAGGGLNSNNSKQIGKSGLDFNFTQPIQLSTSMPHHNTGNNKSVGGFGVTQPGLQKILRSLGPKNQAANGAAVSQHLNANNNSGLTNHAQQNSALGAGSSQSTKNMTGVGTQQRKSSSHKGRRVDINSLNPQAITTSQSSTNYHGKGAASQHHQNRDQQQNSSSIVTNTGSLTNATQNNEQPSSTTAKGRSILKNQINDNLGKLPGRASRNPRSTIDGVPVLPPSSQSNTNPIMGNHASLSFNLNNQPPAIAPTIGIESGGGHTVTQSQQNVARSQSGKRLPRGSDSGQHKKQGGSSTTSKFVSAGSSGGA